MFPEQTSFVLAAFCFAIASLIAIEGLRLRPVDERRRVPREPETAAAAPARALGTDA